MQSQSLLFALFMLAAIPLLFILSDHEVFFITAGIFLLIASIKNSHFKVLKRNRRLIQLHADRRMDDLEEETDLDIRKIDTGVKVVKSLVIILFILYGAFFVSNRILDLLAAGICIYHIHDIMMHLQHYKQKHPVKITRWKGIAFLGVNLATALFILLVAYHKYIKHTL